MGSNTLRANASGTLLRAALAILSAGGLALLLLVPIAMAQQAEEVGPTFDINPEDVKELDVDTIAQTREDDPAYWVNRMQQAMLPQASLRAYLELHSSDPDRAIQQYGGSLVRVESPTAIRSILTIETPIDARRVVKIESRPRGKLERVLYVSPTAPPTSLVLDASEPILLTSVTYEDLGFASLERRAGSTVEFEASSDGAVVRLVSGPYAAYARVVTRLDRQTALPIEVEFFGERGVLVRRVTYSNVARKDLYSYPLRIASKDFHTGFTTTVELSDVEIGPPIYEYEFSDAHLRRLLRIMP